MRKCFDANRFFYNKAIEEINRRYESRKQEFEKAETCVHCNNPKEEGSYTCKSHIKKALPWKLGISPISIRQAVLTKDSDLTEEDIWQKEIPYDTRELAIRQAVGSYNSAVSNKIRGNITNFKMQFLSRKKPRQLFWINDTALKIKDGKVDLFVKRLRQDSTLVIRNRDNRRLPVSNDASAKVLFDKGRYYLVLLVSADKVDIPTDKKNSIALDPGVRTFQTGYSPTGQIYKFGENQAELVKKLHSRIDTLKANTDDKKYKTRYNIKRRLAKLEGKVRDVIDNMHNQCGSMLAKNYDTVLLPSFGTSKMQESDTLCSVVKRRMNSLAHYRFQQKLSYLCQKYYSKLVIVDESYTTRTCGGCGLIKEDVGSDKTYTCKNCHYCLDRDVHGARNIWLKNS